MFDQEFYPTPEALIKIMLEPFNKPYNKIRSFNWEETINYNLKGCILEPSAGKGDILNFISEHADKKSHDDLFAIEKNPDLCHILNEKGYQIIGTDFLNFESDMYFDYIFMNPPFSNGDEHLLKAIEIGSDTQIVCILNAETIKNPYTKNRKLLLQEIKKWGGSIEYHQEAFKQAERKTNVEIAIVRLHVDRQETKFDFEFSDTEVNDIEINAEDFMTNEIARDDMISNLKHIYEKSREAYVKLMKAQEEFYFFSNHITKHKSYDMEITSSNGSPKERYNFLSKQLKKIMWKMVIEELDIQKYMSHNVIKNFDKFISHQSNMAFTKDNVMDFFSMIMMNQSSIIEQAIIDVFDELTRYYKENRNYQEGWKTNDAYKVNEKLILPNGCKTTWDGNNAKQWGTNFQTSWDSKIYNDLDKVLCFITGTDWNKICTVYDALENKFKEVGKIWPQDKFDNTCSSHFFDIKFFKKGTIHLKFRSRHVWEQFNIIATKGKNWLPDSEYEKYQAKQKETQSEQVTKKETVLIEQPLQSLFEL